MSDDLNNDAPASSEGRRYEWFKMWSDVRLNPKLRVVAKKSGQPFCAVMTVWVELLAYANINKQNRGSIDGLSNEVASVNTDLDEDVIDSIINHMQGRLLDGHKIIGWEERQREKTDNTAADRQRAKRAKDAMEQKLAEMQTMLDEQAKIIENLNNQQVTKIESNAVTPDVTPCHADVTPCHAVSRQCHADIDKELDKEIELDLNKRLQGTQKPKSKKSTPLPIPAGDELPEKPKATSSQRPEPSIEPDPDPDPVELASNVVVFDERRPAKAKPKSADAWEAYANAYRQRYGVPPTRNLTTNAQMAAFCKRVSADEAPLIAAFYVEHSKRFYVENLHPVGMLLKDAEALRTQWATGQKVTSTQAAEADKAARFTGNWMEEMADRAVANIRAKEAQERADKTVLFPDEEGIYHAG